MSAPPKTPDEALAILYDFVVSEGVGPPDPCHDALTFLRATFRDQAATITSFNNYVTRLHAKIDQQTVVIAALREAGKE